MRNNSRPVLTIPRTKTEWLWDIIGGGLFLATLVFFALSWGDLPERVPGHINAAGEVDRWGGKGEIFILPIVSVCIWVSMTILERFPHVHNYPQRLNETMPKRFILTAESC